MKNKIRKTHPLNMAHGPKIYTCSQCNEGFEWDDASAWFGTIKDMDESKPLIYTCSNDCRVEMARQLGCQTEHPKLNED